MGKKTKGRREIERRKEGRERRNKKEEEKEKEERNRGREKRNGKRRQSLIMNVRVEIVKVFSNRVGGSERERKWCKKDE